MKTSYLTVTDQFCGAGGSTLGAKSAGVEVRLGLNHWKVAVEPFESGRAMAFPDTYRVCGTKRDQVKQYGNAVTPPVMDLLIRRGIESLHPELGA